MTKEVEVYVCGGVSACHGNFFFSTRNWNALQNSERGNANHEKKALKKHAGTRNAKRKCKNVGTRHAKGLQERAPSSVNGEKYLPKKRY